MLQELCTGMTYHPIHSWFDSVLFLCLNCEIELNEWQLIPFTRNNTILMSSSLVIGFDELSPETFIITTNRNKQHNSCVWLTVRTHYILNTLAIIIITVTTTKNAVGVYVFICCNNNNHNNNNYDANT